MKTDKIRLVVSHRNTISKYIIDIETQLFRSPLSKISEINYFTLTTSMPQTNNNKKL